MSKPPGIYVEILIRGPMDEVWRLTQDPALHERWDLRFTTIRYLPRPAPDSPQRFLYATRIGFGLGIEGEGESVGRADAADGSRTSSLKFWSADPRSLIREGSGYWQYVPLENGVKFLTWYDYSTRFGAAGRVLDWVFRPLLGWATAWSFDRLRLWIECGRDPEASWRLSAAHVVARMSVAFVFLWHGLVPKLLFPDPDEAAMLTDAGVSAAAAATLVVAAGIGEIVLGAALLFSRSRTLLALVIAAMTAAGLHVAWHSPRFLSAAFNPVSLNACVIALAAIALVTARDLPSARRCRRVREG